MTRRLSLLKNNEGNFSLDFIPQGEEKNRTQGFLEEINRTADWTPIQEALHQEYPVGQSTFGNKAYPPITLLKAMLLQKWYGFRLPSSP